MTIKVIRRVNTTDSMEMKLLLCHICRDKVPIVSRMPDGKMACAKCYPPGTKFIREVDGPGPVADGE